MIEIEVKLLIKDMDDLIDKLTGNGFNVSERIHMTDTYFDSADNRIRDNGEALRVREVKDLNTGEDTTAITFKGKRLDSVLKTRRELETSVGSAEVCMEIFKALGLQPVKPWVTKTRTEYTRDNMTACVDQVEGLGNYFELEIVIPEDGSREEAKEKIGSMLSMLGYSIDEAIKDSYLSLLRRESDVD